MDGALSESQGEMLGNRVRKNQRRLRKWLRRDQVTCYRLYDRDIPEIPLAIDRYEERLHVACFSDWKEERIRSVLEPTCAALDIDPAKMFIKSRRRQKGVHQYQGQGSADNRFEVLEGGHRFLVNLVDYIDTGLFLDHRKTRAMVQAGAAGKSVLNLFCYTGAFSVYAAAGGAQRTLAVDRSATYLEWARANLERNGFSPAAHRLVRADVMRELEELAERRERFDLAVVDPPTFSNSKNSPATFDVQRDHVELLERVAELLIPSGRVYFSTNNRRFRWQPEDLKRWFHAEEISHRTLPEDFRDKKIHRSFLLERR